MAKLVQCPMCGATFETSKKNRKYCSLVCKDAGQRLQRLRWKLANMGYYTEYMKQYREQKKEGNEDET